jgi:succinate dehydrogenase / fumarate reductase membrane anchor subunit
MVKRVVVGAHYGVGGFLAQRLTAAYMALFTLVFATVLLTTRPTDYSSWKTLVSQGWLRFGLFLFVVCVLVHAWIGMRDIWMDYIKPTGLRLTLEAATAFWLVGCGGWAVQILWRL